MYRIIKVKVRQSAAATCSAVEVLFSEFGASEGSDKRQRWAQQPRSKPNLVFCLALQNSWCS